MSSKVVTNLTGIDRAIRKFPKSVDELYNFRKLKVFLQSTSMYYNRKPKFTIQI